MAIDVFCKRCGHAFQVDTKAAGSRRPCPSCQSPVSVPSPADGGRDVGLRVAAGDASLDERLAAIEAKCVSLRRSLGARTFVMIACLGGLMSLVLSIEFVRWQRDIPALASTPALPSSIAAERFVLVDAKGIERGSLSCSSKGLPMLTLLCRDGSRLQLGDSPGEFGGPSLAFLDAKRHERLSMMMRTNETGPTYLGIQDTEGRPALFLEYSPASKSASVELSPADPMSEAVISMILARGGFASLQVVDGKGKHLLDVPPQN